MWYNGINIKRNEVIIMYYEVVFEGETLFGKPYLKTITFQKDEEELIGDCLREIQQDETVKKIIVKCCKIVLTKDK